jgi:hypothetical protein
MSLDIWAKVGLQPARMTSPKSAFTSFANLAHSGDNAFSSSDVSSDASQNGTLVIAKVKTETNVTAIFVNDSVFILNSSIIFMGRLIAWCIAC